MQEQTPFKLYAEVASTPIQRHDGHTHIFAFSKITFNLISSATNDASLNIKQTNKQKQKQQQTNNVMTQ